MKHITMVNNDKVESQHVSRRHLLGMGAAGMISGGFLSVLDTVPAQARENLPAFDTSQLQSLVNAAHARFITVTDGKNADYIPYLATVSPKLFGIAIVTPDGSVIEAGDTSYAFAIESISKVFTLALVMGEIGPDAVAQKLGTNSTGLPFNSVIALELHKDNPISPLVNAGAMATVSLVSASSPDERWKKISDNMNDFATTSLNLNQEVYKSETDTNQHNRAIAYLLQSAGYMYSDPMSACDIYTRQCSIGVTTKELAMMAGTLANNGINPFSKQKLLESSYVPKLLAEMAVEGLYDTSGQWQYDVGLPAKSGVGGGIMAVSPGNFAIVAFSPPLDKAGNSVRAQQAISWIAAQLDANMYAD
jgi:glutaminase